MHAGGIIIADLHSEFMIRQTDLRRPVFDLIAVASMYYTCSNQDSLL